MSRCGIILKLLVFFLYLHKLGIWRKSVSRCKTVWWIKSYVYARRWHQQSAVGLRVRETCARMLDDSAARAAAAHHGCCWIKQRGFYFVISCAQVLNAWRSRAGLGWRKRLGLRSSSFFSGIFRIVVSSPSAQAGEEPWSLTLEALVPGSSPPPGGFCQPFLGFCRRSSPVFRWRIFFV